MSHVLVLLAHLTITLVVKCLFRHLNADEKVTFVERKQETGYSLLNFTDVVMLVVARLDKT